MDPVSAVATLLTIAISVKTWLDDIEEKDSTIVAVSATINRICTILEPFKDAKNLDPIIKSSLLGLGDALARTKEHLSVWKSKRPRKRRINSLNSLRDFLEPSAATKLLKEDEWQLSLQITVMLLSFTADNYFRTRLPTISGSQDTSSARPIYNEELREFWQEYVGAEVYSVPSPVFCHALERWLGRKVNELALKGLVFRLDEFLTGEVILANLEVFVGSGSLSVLVDTFEGPRAPPLSTYDSSSLPLIVWVDDVPTNNLFEVQFAQRLNVKVILLHSTALAKDWIESNEVFLRSNDALNRIRFISDNARFEIGSRQEEFQWRESSLLNISAGENILRYLRGRRYTAPVLVYCGQSINATQYVISYENAGSTVSQQVVNHYIQALADGRDDDAGWKGFKVL